MNSLPEIVKRYFAICLASLWPVLFAAASGDVQSRTILLVDDQDVLYRSGTERVMCPLRRHDGNPVIRGREKAYEVAVAWTSVYRNPASGGYQLWYQAFAGDEARDRTRRCVVCYAESADGVHFSKPNLGLFDYNGETNTSIVLVGNGGTSDRYGVSVVVDEQSRDASRRYKMAYFDFTRDNGAEYPGLSVAFSPDGIHWTKHPHGPLSRVSYGEHGEPVPFAGETNRPWAIPLSMADAMDALYDPGRRVFAIYGKMWIDGPDGGMRWKHATGRIESEDFVHWSKPRLVAAPDEQDPAWVEFHTMPVFFYNGRYFSPIQVLDRKTEGGVVDVELAVSPDGLDWRRPFRRPFWLARSQGGKFDSGAIFLCAQPVFLKDEIRFYYGAYSKGATGSDDLKLTTGIGLATMPRDRFAGLRPAPRSDQPTLKKPLEKIGQVTLKPIDLSKAQALELNADAGGGSIRVEILDGDGKRVRGFSFDDAVPITGDSLRHPVRWRAARLKDLPPGGCMPRIHLSKATVYALTIRNDRAGAGGAARGHRSEFAVAAEAGLEKIVLRKQGDDGVHTYRIPGLTTTKAGSLLAVFDLRHQRSGDLPADIDVGVRRSTDGGKTWSPMAPVLDFDKNVRGSAGNGVGDPCILADTKTGSIFVAGLWSFGHRGWNGSGPGLEPKQTGQFVLARSDDDGKTWSKPINITKQVKDPSWHLCYQGPGRGIQLRDGTLVMPAQFKDGSTNAIAHSFFIYSEDHGKTWKPSPPAIPLGEKPMTTEAQVAETAEGNILISMRNHDGRKQRAWSVFRRNPKTGKLEGGSWSPVRFDLPDPTCAAALVSVPSKIASEDLMVFANPASKSKRENMTVYLSRDGGKTWPMSRLLDARPAAYSCLTVLPDGRIGLLYEAGDTGAYEELVFARFPLTWLTENAAAEQKPTVPGCFPGAEPAVGAQDHEPFGIRGIKGCYWEGIEKYRLALPWIAEHKMNFLMLCPTSFKASGPDWRTDYAETEKKQIAELVTNARKRKVQVCLGFNPGLWSKPPLEYSSERDYGIIRDKAKTAFALGMDWVSLCLDDISSELLPADKSKFGRLEHAHAGLVNRLWNDMKTMNPRAKLIFCPSVYCDDHVRNNLDYIKTIGEKVEPEVMLFWTGPQVCSASITSEHARNIARILRRKPFIWDNYPVNDAFNWGPYMSPLQNRSADLASECAGYIANEMKQWHMSTIALATTAEYLRDPGNYNPSAAIERVIRSYPADQRRALRLLVDIYGQKFWGQEGFPPWPKPASIEEAEQMLSNYRELREELCGHKQLQPLWDDVRPMLETNIQFLKRKCSRRMESPLKALGYDFEGGGAEKFGYQHWGTIVNYVYAKPTGKHEMSALFNLDRMPAAGATLRIVARGDGAPKQIRIQVMLNDLTLVDGASPFRYDQFETREFDIPSGNLRIGPNNLVIRNIETEGGLGDRPHFIVSEAELILK